MEQDESTGLITDSSGDITPVERPPLAELRDDQMRYFGRWTAERNVT